MIKNRIGQILRTKEIDELNNKNNDLLCKLEYLSEKIDAYADLFSQKHAEIVNSISDCNEFLSLDNVFLINKNIRVLICGFYGARNLGDELMLNAVLKRLDSVGIDATVMLANNHDLDASIYFPHSIVHYPRKSLDVTFLAEQFDVIIWGGGAVIDDENYRFKENEVGLTYILCALSKAILKKGGKVIALGVSSNKELSNTRFIKDMDYIVKNATYFSLRDKYSLETLKNSGIRIDNVKIIDDLALSDIVPGNPIKTTDEKVVIGLVYVMDDNKRDLLIKYTNSLVEMIKKEYGADRAIDLRLIPFYDYNNNDKKRFIEIKEKCLTDLPENVRIIEVDYMNDIEELVDEFMHCGYVVSMRYHATLIAGCLGVNVLAIDLSETHRHYHNKLKYVKEKYCPELISFSYGKPVDEFVEALRALFKKPRQKTLDADILRALSDNTKNAIEEALKYIKN